MRRHTVVSLIGLSFAALLLLWTFFGGSPAHLGSVDRMSGSDPLVVREEPVSSVADRRETKPSPAEAKQSGGESGDKKAEPDRAAKTEGSAKASADAQKSGAAEPNSEVIQEKRQIRIRKKQKAKPSNARAPMVIGGSDEVPSTKNDGERGNRQRNFAKLRDAKQRAARTREREKLHEQAELLRHPPLTEEDLDVTAGALDESLDGFENRRAVVEQIAAKPMTDTSVDPMSTFSIDVDTGAYTLARARLRSGYLPKKEHVRIEEFLNYFHYDYPQPANGAFAAHLEAAPDPFGSPEQHLIRVGIQGRDVAEAERPPAHLTFLIDVSGSMFGHDKLGLAREALELVTRNLRTDDTVAIVTYARGAHVELWPAGARETDLVMGAISRIEAGGSSALDEGLDLAYRVAATHFYAGHVNRVVVMGDGRANVGDTDPKRILSRIRAGVEDGVTMSTIGFGAKAFNDTMMERLADNGNGNYFFVDSYREAERVFRDRLCGTIHAIANDVKIQVEFNPTNVERFRLLGYENRKLEHQQFRDDKVDAGEIGAGHSVTALYAVVLRPNPTGTLASVRVRHKPPGESIAMESEFELHAEELVADVRTASPDFKFSAAVALFAEALRGEAEMSEARISLIQEIAGEGITAPGDQIDRTEFVALLEEVRPYFAN